MKSDPLRLEIFRNLYASVADEMGAALGRSASSINIKERKDYSCAVFDARGRMIAQAAHIPVHLGSMPLSVAAAIGELRLFPRDVAILNDPYRGGTHLPDVTLVRPVFLSGRLRFFVACRAHYSDIGGMTPGSMPLSTDLHQEGFVLPPMKLTDAVRRLMMANVRNSGEAEADLEAQRGACATGLKRLAALARRYGVRELLEQAEGLQRHARSCMVAAIRELRPGRHRFEDALDGDGVEDGVIPIRVTVERRGDDAIVDFTGTAPQARGSVNAVYAVTVSAVLYCFRCLVREEIPLNAGAASPIRIVAPKGSLVNAQAPAAVAAGNVETSQRIVDVVFGALAKAAPGRIPAASQGTMNNLSFGGAGFAYYETSAGGMGARKGCAGASGTHSHMTNTLNTPIEAFERAYPVRVATYSLRPRSGGAGRWRGGDGLVRELEFLAPAQVSLVAERRRTAPYGLAGGRPGKPGRDTLNGRRIAAKANFGVAPGDRLRVETPGGGGYGFPA
ncbi:MAG: hydantoinase B/oxoprolinase family protein [Planctomycetes bacterium]|nr:hydantoinase B/oxoprolinase family protein [Planctomycetota bacterium]